MFFGVSLRRLISARLNNEVDKDEANKNKAKSHIIVDLMTLALQFSFFLA